MANNDIVSRYEIEAIKESINRLEKIYDIVNRQTIATEKLALEMKYMREEQEETKNRVKILEDKPNKRLDSVITQILGNIIALVIGVLAVIIGLKK